MDGGNDLDGHNRKKCRAEASRDNNTVYKHEKEHNTVTLTDIKWYSLRESDELVLLGGEWYLSVSVTFFLFLKSPENLNSEMMRESCQTSYQLHIFVHM